MRQPVLPARSRWRAELFRSVHGLLAPPRTVGSLATITHSTPSTTPMPVDHAGADRELGAPGRERRQLEERASPGRAAVRCARGRAACRARGGGSTYFSPPPAERLGVLGVESRRACRSIASAVARVLRRRRVESRLQRRHDAVPQIASRRARSGSRWCRRRCPGCACRGTGAPLRRRACSRGRRCSCTAWSRDPLARLDGGVLREAHLGDESLVAAPRDRSTTRRDVDAGDVDPAGHLGQACAAPTCRLTSGRPNVSRSRHHARSGRGSAARSRTPARPARSARSTKCRAICTNPLFSAPTRLATGTRTSTKDSSAVSEQCQPIFSSSRVTVKPGVSVLDHQQRDPARRRDRRCGPR